MKFKCECITLLCTFKSGCLMRTYIIADNQYITALGISTLIKEKVGAENILNAVSMKDLQFKIKLYPTSVVIVDYTLFNFISMEQMLIVK